MLLLHFNIGGRDPCAALSLPYKKDKPVSPISNSVQWRSPLLEKEKRPRKASDHDTQGTFIIGPPTPSLRRKLVH